ncbi:MAG TPA: hypothetical protein VLV83_21190 [Acidobacteriota bacterium]|nr:hypothetical protein [Acidobacteriota bacterium]
MFLSFLILLPASSLAQDPLTFNKTFVPDTIGPGSVTTLRFDITNNTSQGARGVAFTDTLPAGVLIAGTPSVQSTCLGGTVSVPAGGSTISYSDGGVGASSSCSIRVDVTSSAVGTHTNVSGTLTSDIGTGGTATDDLIVADNRPGFSKSFSPNPAIFGGRSTLTFTIDNSANSNQAVNLRFTDALPVGMTVANPSNSSRTCTGGIVTAVPGSNVISYGPNPLVFQDASVAAGATCTVSVDVIAGAVGSLDNISGELTSVVGPQFLSSGNASATLVVNAARLSLVKTFTDDPATPGGTVNLEFTIRNLDRRSGVNTIEFSDDLDAVISGLTAIGLPLADPCGSGSSLDGTSVISLAGGNLPPEGSCTFSVDLQVPSSASAGTFFNTTSTITAMSDLGDEVSGAAASDLLVISVAPMLTKTFLDNPVGAGGSTTLEFMITNASSTSTASNISFEDVFDVVLPTASSVPGMDFCGTGSTATFTPLINPTGGETIPARLVIAGASLAPDSSCTFSITLDVAADAPESSVENTTSPITALIDDQEVTGDAATDILDIVGAPALIKEFTDDPVLPGEMVTLEFTLTHSEFASAPATGISFSDDLTSALTGLSATGLPQTDVCGAGSQIDGTTNLLFTDGSLGVGESCTFSVTLQVPANAPFGRHPNTTSGVVATVGGVSATNGPADDDLMIAGLTLTKEFTDDPALPGSTATLSFTIENLSDMEGATGITFSDEVDGTLPGLMVSGSSVPQSDICGVGSSLTSPTGTTLVFQGGSLDPSASCTFSVTLDVPSDALSDDYPNTTINFRATIAGELLLLENAFDILRVNGDILEIAKEFIDDPVGPGDVVTLRFSIDNLDPGRSITDIEFTDDLDAVFSGLVSVSGVLTDVCGMGSQLSGVSLLSLTGGNLTPAGTISDSCTFDVTLQVPSDVPLSASLLNETSPVTGLADSILVDGIPASDSLQIDRLEFTKMFQSDPMPGEIVELTFNIESFDDSNTITDLSFVDDVDAVLFGLAAVGLPAADVCGAGSVLDGTSVISLTGGNLLPLGSCTFSVMLQVPAGAGPGNFVNTTSDLTQAGLAVADPAMDTLIVLEPPADADGDSVLDVDDVCPGTMIPEGVPTEELNPNHYALIDDDGIFDTKTKAGKPPRETFTIADTAGCSCEQIIEGLELGEGQVKHGCSLGSMRDWVELVGGSSTSSGSVRPRNGRR